MNSTRQIAAPGRTQLTCSTCGGQFLRPNAHIRNTTHSCSRECSKIVRAKRPLQTTTHTCEYCHKVFTRRLGYGGQKRFCSPTCRIKGLPMPKGEAAYNWKGGTATRSHAEKLIIQKRITEEGACERCGATQKLQGHHKSHYAKFPDLRADPRNIEVLCAKCHAKEHPDMAHMILRPAIRTGVVIHCERCGTEKYVKPSQAKIAKFCSHECQRAVLHDLTRERHRLGLGVLPNRSLPE